MEVVIATYGDVNDTPEEETNKTTIERTLNSNPWELLKTSSTAVHKPHTKPLMVFDDFYL